MKDQARKLLEDMSQGFSEATELRLKSIAIEIAVDHPEIFAQYWYDAPCDPELWKILKTMHAYGAGKIKLIKEYREHTGEGLKESKDFIEEHWTF